MQTKFATLALSGLLALGVTGAAFAQDNPPPPPPIRVKPDHPKAAAACAWTPTDSSSASPRELNLTTDQQNQIKPLLVDRQQKMQALMQNESLSQDDRRAQARTICDGHQ